MVMRVVVLVIMMMILRVMDFDDDGVEGTDICLMIMMIKLIRALP